MPAFISPLDGNYVSLKRAALLIAQEQPGIEPDEIMEMFKHAIFAHEFEREEPAVHAVDLTEDWNLPLLRIEAPPTGSAAPHLPPEHQPQEYFAVKGETVAEVLSEREALPGRAEEWLAFATFPRNMRTVGDALHALARIPYAAFPAKAHDILGNILLAKIKLRSWMEFKGYELPSFLKGAAASAQRESTLKPTDMRTEDAAADASRGRPRKAGWLRVEQLIREMHAARPELSRSALAYDARLRAAAEVAEEDLPSLETIARQMKIILPP